MLCARLRTPAARLVLRAPLSTVATSRVAIAGLRVAGMRVSTPPYRCASSAVQLAPRDLHSQVESQEAEVEVEEDIVEDGSTTLEFSSLKGVIHTKTYNALTKSPFTYVDMTPVQNAVLSQLPELAHTGKDLLVKAKTGTGKTIAFLVPATEARLNCLKEAVEKAESRSGMKDERMSYGADEAYARKHVGTLIISPTRELAMQIAVEASKLTSHHKHGVHLFVGGESLERQMRGFEKGRKDIVVATPGRLKDIFQSRPEVRATFDKINTLVLDEADTLLDMGFRSDIESLLLDLPTERQTFLFSATVSPAIRTIARQALDRKHAFIDCVAQDDSPVHAHIPQYRTTLESGKDQIPHVLRLISQDQLLNPGKSKIMLFCSTKRGTILMAEVMKGMRRYLPDQRTELIELHADINQNSRRRRSDMFRASDSGSTVLITSDVSARGVDYPNVTRVIQVGVPASGDQYVHRVGRTGRGSNTSGRGDLVLLPFEEAWPQWCLGEVALKETPVDAVKAEVTRLAEEYDADPKGYSVAHGMPVGQPIRRKPDPRDRFAQKKFKQVADRLSPVQAFAPGVSTRMQQLEEAIEEDIKRFDSTMLEETFTSMLGYYVSNTDNLKMDKMDILQSCKDWYTSAFSAEPPHLSEGFLKKLGVLGGGRSSSRNGRGGFGGGMVRRGRPGEWNSDGGMRRRSSSEGRPPRRSFDGESRPPRSFEEGDRPPRRSFEDGDRPPRRSFTDGDRPPRRSFSGGSDRPSRGSYGVSRPSYGDRDRKPPGGYNSRRDPSE